MPSRPPGPCTQPGCPELTTSGRCPAHATGRWDRSKRKASLPANWQRLRLRILKRDGHRCYLCGASANRVDHVTPAYLGGTDMESNLAAICGQCDSRKSAIEGNNARWHPSKGPKRV